MKKLFIILIALSMFMVFPACENPEDVEAVNEAISTQNYIPVDPETNEPLVFTGCDITPIDENVLFYFFTDNKTLWKFSGVFIDYYYNESVKLSAVMHFENSEDQDIDFSPYEFFSRDGFFFYSWLISDEHLDEEGNYVARVIRYYKQKDGRIDEVGIYDFDGTPDEYYSYNYLSDNFSTEIYSYEGEVVNRLTNLQESTYRVFYKISRNLLEISDGVAFLENGIFFNVLNSGQPGLSEGLYFSYLDRSNVTRIKEKGRLWVQGLIW